MIILEEAGRSRQRNHLLYSRTPDWANEEPPTRLQVRAQEWRAGGDTELHCRVQTYRDHRVLIIPGIALDSIKTVGGASSSCPFRPETAKEFQTVQRIHSLSATSADSDSLSVNGDSLPEAVGRTLIADLDQYPPADIVDSFGK